MFVLFCCLKSLKYILFHMNINHVRLPVLLGSVLGRGQNQRIRGRNRYLLRPPGGRWRSREEKGERDRGHLVNAVADRGQGKAQGPSTSQIYQLGEVLVKCSAGCWLLAAIQQLRGHDGTPVDQTFCPYRSRSRSTSPDKRSDGQQQMMMPSAFQEEPQVGII